MPPKPKRSGKGKAKKEARKRELEEERARKSVAAAASAVPDLLADFAAFAKFERNGLALDIDCFTSASLPPELLSEMFALLEGNMKQLYLEGGWGWRRSDKLDELTDPASRHLVVRTRDEPRTLAAFAHFRFVEEGRALALYIYELQVSKEFERRGLGRHLTQLMELLARRHGMEWVMCTVFKTNEPSMNFFMGKMKFTIDETSPSFDPDMGEQSYEILSKCVDPELRRQLQAAAGAAARESGRLPASS